MGKDPCSNPTIFIIDHKQWALGTLPNGKKALFCIVLLFEIEYIPIENAQYKCTINILHCYYSTKFMALNSSSNYMK